MPLQMGIYDRQSESRYYTPAEFGFDNVAIVVAPGTTGRIIDVSGLRTFTIFFNTAGGAAIWRWNVYGTDQSGLEIILVQQNVTGAFGGGGVYVATSFTTSPPGATAMAQRVSFNAFVAAGAVVSSAAMLGHVR